MKFAVSTVILFLLFSFPVSASVSFNGYLKSFFLFNNYPETPDFTIANINTARARLFWEPANDFALNAAYAVSPSYISDSQGFGAASPYRCVDFNNQLYPLHAYSGSGFVIMQNLDRMNFVYRAGSLDLGVGRQPVALGSARVINPTDIFTPFSYQELNKEERTGVDAVRLTIPLGQLGEIDSGYVIGEKFEESLSALYIKVKFNKWDTDWSVILAGFMDNMMLGLDVAGSLLDAGIWLETAYVFSGILKRYNSDNNYFRISAGFDYSFTGNLYFFAEYHFNGAGSTHFGNYRMLP
ncbi:MAG: hypothetical protein JXA66_06070, partial [Oligoflexia bacterium]|nr:hypothetical protein [Oligoflexia bacterium]